MVTDGGLVIKDIKHNVYYCGLNTWNKQLRKAKIYHSAKWAHEAIDYNYSDIKDDLKLVPVTISAEE